MKYKSLYRNINRLIIITTNQRIQWNFNKILKRQETKQTFIITIVQTQIMMIELQIRNLIV